MRFWYAVLIVSCVLIGCNNPHGGVNAIATASRITTIAMPPAPTQFGSTVGWSGLEVSGNNVLAARYEWETVVGPMYQYTSTNEIVKSVDGGMQWISLGVEEKTSYVQPRTTLFSFLDTNLIFRGDVSFTPAPPIFQEVFITANGGTTWGPPPQWPSNLSGSVRITNVRFDVNGIPNFVIGIETPQNSVIGMRWDGQQWVNLTFPASIISANSNIFVQDIGVDDEIFLAESSNMSEVYRSTDGVTWEQLLKPTFALGSNTERVCVYGKTSDGRYYVLGRSGMAIERTVGSKVASYVEYRFLSPVLQYLYPPVGPIKSAWARGDNLWIAADTGEVFYSSDAGTTWELLYQFTKPSSYVLFAHGSRKDLWMIQSDTDTNILVRHRY